MIKPNAKKKPGPKPLPIEKRRTGRLAMRTYPDVVEKARRVGTVAVEDAIRKIEENNLNQDVSVSKVKK